MPSTISVGTKQRSPYDTSSKVNVVVLLREVGKEVHVVLQHAVWLFLYAGCIHVELAHQHTVCGFGVLVGAVSSEVVLHLASAEELVCGSQIAALHLVEDGLSVNKSALREVEVDAGTQKFLCEHRHVKVV